MVGDERKGVREVSCSQEAMLAPLLVVNVFLYQKMRAGIAISCAGRHFCHDNFWTFLHFADKLGGPATIDRKRRDPCSSLGGCWVD